MLERAGMSSQHREQGHPFLATVGCTMIRFKPNMKSQGDGHTAHGHNHQDQIHSKT